MKSWMIHLYAQLMKKYFGYEPSFKRAFQLQLVEWKFFGRYSGGSRLFLVFPLGKGRRILVEIKKDAKIRAVLKKLLKEWEQAVVTSDEEKYTWTLNQIFAIAKENAVNVFLEELENDTLIRKRIGGGSSRS